MLSFRPPLDRPLRRPEHIRAMRDMLFVGGFAMPYGTIVGVAGPIFAGLMLQMGVEKAAIGSSSHSLRSPASYRWSASG
jgi:hypothetical protein